MSGADEGAKAPSVSPFEDTIHTYWRSVTAYRQFGELVATALSEHQEKHLDGLKNKLDSIISPFKDAATAEEKIHMSKALRNIGRAFEVKAQQVEALEVNEEETATDDYNNEDLDELFMSPRAGRTFIQVLKQLDSMSTVYSHEGILFSGILTGLVGQFEVLLSDLAYQFYRRAPLAVGVQERTLAVTELITFTSIDDAIDYLIEQRVDDLLRGSAEDWRKFFESRMKLDPAEISPDWERFVECVQRRHLIVHSGGRISRRYLKNVPSHLVQEYFGEPRLGDTAYLDEIYVSNALTLFETTGLLLAFSCWQKLAADPEGLNTVLMHIIYESLLQNQWGTVLRLADWGVKQNSFIASQKLPCQVNLWLAYKRLGRFGECEKEVRNFDTSALKTVYSLVQAALLNDNDRFFSLLETSKGQDLDEAAWDEWPVFDEMRQDPRFNECKARYTDTKIKDVKKDNPTSSIEDTQS